MQSRRGNVKIKAYDGMSCLHAAAQSGHLDCVRFLVSVNIFVTFVGTFLLVSFSILFF